MLSCNFPHLNQSIVSVFDNDSHLNTNGLFARKGPIQFHKWTNYCSGSDRRRKRFSRVLKQFPSDNKCCARPENYKFTGLQDLDSDLNMPVVQVSAMRRQAVADIFRDIRPEDIERLCSVKQDYDECENEPEVTCPCRRRAALADIFHDVSEDELAKILSEFGQESNVSSVTTNIHKTRRRALGNIFQDIDKEDIEHVLCEFDGEMYNYANTDLAQRRRCGLPDIFQDLDFELIKRITADHDDDNVFIPENCRHRRFGQANVFENLRIEDVRQISPVLERLFSNEGCYCHQHPEILNRRRPGLADIFNDIAEDDLGRLSDMCNHD